MAEKNPTPECRQPDHEWVTEDGVQKCCKCGISWLDSVRGVSISQLNFEMPSKSHRHKRIIEGMGGGEQ